MILPRPSVWAVIAALLVPHLPGCGPRVDNSKVRLAVPTESSTVGPEDVFVMEIVGEKDLPTEYQVAPDGTVDIPYIHRIRVEGLEPHDISALVRQKLMEAKVLTDPSVIVRVKEYNSKHVTVLGQVQKPGSFPYTSGLSLIQAISMAGGFNAIANKDHVNLTRKTKTGTDSVALSVDAIMEGESPDIPLQAGDQIYVPERIF